MNFKVVPLTYGQISQAGNPADANQPEAIPGVLFDTQTCTAAASGAQLTFFQSNSISDDSLTNVLGGQLPQGYAFRIQSIGCDVLREPTVTAAIGSAGIVTDIERLLKTNRAFVELTKSSKSYGLLPLSFCHASGGATGSVEAYGTAAAQTIQQGNNGIFSGGFQTDGSILIQSKEVFKITMRFASAVTALAVDTPLRLWLRGTMYRPVR